jgi:glycerate kinase
VPVAHSLRPPLVLAAPDAFKGTAPAAAIAGAVAAGAEGAGWACDQCPLSDGGEGFAAVVASAPTSGEGDPGRWTRTTVTGPLGRPVVAPWYLRGTEAVIESAAASGLPLAGGPDGNDPVAATTRGTGELIAAAVAAGARRVLLGVGGSATTDGGLGAVEAIDEAGGLGDAELVVACDVKTLFLDAAAVFGPQKGAGPDQVVVLRRRLEELAVRYAARGVEVTSIVGAGAAGGLAGGLTVLGARLVPGFDVVAGAVALQERVGLADLVVTGEGRLDASSWAGKVVGGVRRLARSLRVPLVVVAGAVGPGGATPGLEVVDLSARFGPDRSLADPVGCVADALRSDLMQRSP